MCFLINAAGQSHRDLVAKTASGEEEAGLGSKEMSERQQGERRDTEAQEVREEKGAEDSDVGSARLRGGEKGDPSPQYWLRREERALGTNGRVSAEARSDAYVLLNGPLGCTVENKLRRGTEVEDLAGKVRGHGQTQAYNLAL